MRQRKTSVGYFEDIQSRQVEENTHCNILEAHANDEVGSPVGKASHSHGSRPWTLGEQLSYKEPGNGTRTDLKEGYEAKDGQHADVAHPWNTFLSGENKKRKGSEVCRENILNLGSMHLSETDQQSEGHGHDDGTDAHPPKSQHVERPSSHPFYQEELLIRKCGNRDQLYEADHSCALSQMPQHAYSDNANMVMMSRYNVYYLLTFATELQKPAMPEADLSLALQAFHEPKFWTTLT